MQENGGIPYGLDFEYAPDTDDTGLFVVVMTYFKDKYFDKISLSNTWLKSMQNDDGGYGAFDKGKVNLKF